ncbi:MAG: hypothetical protein A2Y25_07235 [Candidatus Melainabacteria bacterium GWF2_37_15]|nr:MAG: hypothetical protein A2Y25_07235 [Candidatus Melainabacteria bacterium GWF2_37_15]
MEIIFYSAAQDEIFNIYDTTDEKWGEKQADNYISGLYETVGLAAKRQKNWRKYGDLAEDAKRPIYFVSYKRHCIFFEVIEEENAIGVIGVFHEAMDIPARLLDAIVSLGREPRA